MDPPVSSPDFGTMYIVVSFVYKAFPSEHIKLRRRRKIARK